MLVTENCQDYFDEVVRTAKASGQYDNLKERLDYLESYACHPDDDGNVDLEQTRCLLFKDYAPLSFMVRMEKREPSGSYKHWYVAGLIYHGPHDNGGDGSAPTFSVNIGGEYGWSLHT